MTLNEVYTSLCDVLTCYILKLKDQITYLSNYIDTSFTVIS